MNTTTVYTNFRSHILAITEVTDIVGNGVYFGVVPENAAIPAITLNPSGGDRPFYYQNSFDFANISIQVGVYSRDFSHLLSIFDTLNSELNSYHGLLNSNADALVTRTTVNPFTVIPQEDGVHGLVFDIETYYDGA